MAHEPLIKRIHEINVYLFMWLLSLLTFRKCVIAWVTDVKIFAKGILYMSFNMAWNQFVILVDNTLAVLLNCNMYKLSVKGMYTFMWAIKVF